MYLQQGNGMGKRRIRVSLGDQRLELMEDDAVLETYPISSSLFGAGEQSGTFRTPRGRHVIRAKIGDGAPSGTVFRGRRPTGEIYSDELAVRHPERDWILSRILWLSGTEVGLNRLGDVDTMRRYIYIHGTPESRELGTPASIGCIRMSDEDVIELFDMVPPGTVVDIDG